MSARKERVKEITEGMETALKNVLQSGSSVDESKVAEKPMTTDITSLNKKTLFERLVNFPKRDPSKMKTLKGFQTWTLLDSLYLNQADKSLNGIPLVGQIGVTGLPSSGKSILMKEIAVLITGNAKPEKVLFVLSEDSFVLDSPRYDLESRLSQTAKDVGADWKNVSDNLFVLDTIARNELREWNCLAETYRYIINKEDIKFVIFDSLTLLDTYRGALKVRLQELCRYNQINGITAIYVNQRSSEDWDIRGMAGGIGLGHILDSTVLVDYGVPSSWKAQLKQDFRALGFEVKQGVRQNFVRVMGCRLCGFDGKYKPVEITSNGLLRMRKPPEKDEAKAK